MRETKRDKRGKREEWEIEREEIDRNKMEKRKKKQSKLFYFFLYILYPLILFTVKIHFPFDESQSLTFCTTFNFTQKKKERIKETKIVQKVTFCD